MNELEMKKEKAYDLYMKGLSIGKASNEAGIDERTLSRLLKKRNIDTTIHSRKYRFNEDYFKKIDTEDKAYWLGFIYADGCVRENQGKNKNKGLGLEISLKESDKSHLEKFINQLGIRDSSIIKRRVIKLKNKEYVAYKVVINSTKLCKDLITNGATPRKSLTLQFPSKEIIQDDLLNHFIRGYFDGDGNVGVRNTQRYKNCPRITVLGTEAFLSDLKNHLEEVFQVTSVKIQRKKDNKAFSYQKTGNDARKILSYMYNGASVYLERKYEEYKRILPY
ncbi:UPF0175 family protein [Bacillus mycoides]|uniref:UPF0175 family protein n=1 Tax=Bacillus mycoides TaxID=1405 RepID=UPI001C035F5A|nr:UPF0175 family protein [Bacillus mycoides]QWI10073.1 hypothetical protein EXW47_06510 [Bacillus mycoides]